MVHFFNKSSTSEFALTLSINAKVVKKNYYNFFIHWLSYNILETKVN